MSKQNNQEIARELWGEITRHAMDSLEELEKRYSLSIAMGDLLYLQGRWYVTHTGLLRIASRKCCSGIHVLAAVRFCDPAASRWAFKATVYKSRSCRGFVGYGDADPSNVSPLVHGAEMRVAETRAVNRALRKAYGIGICSVEELGSSGGSVPSNRESKRLPPQPANGNYGGPKVRDRLCQIIRQHHLDGSLVKAYAIDLMSIHEHLPPQARKELKDVGWTKGLELAKVARRNGKEFDCATWLHKAREMPREEFKREVEKELTGRETEPWEIIYFKFYKSQIPVIEQAIETAALMLGTDKSRGYCLEMICADFLAGVNLDNGNPEILLQSIRRFFKFLPGEQKQAFVAQLNQRMS